MKERNEKKKSMYTYVKNQKGLVIILLVIAVAFFLLIIPERKEASSVNHSQRLSDYESRIEEKIEKGVFIKISDEEFWFYNLEQGEAYKFIQ